MSDTTTPARPKVLRFYRGRDGDHRWQMRAGNGKVIADSAEGYRRKGAAERGALGVLGSPGFTGRIGDHGQVIGRSDVRVEWDT